MKAKTKKQKKADKAFIKKLSSLNIGGKFVASKTPPPGVPGEIHVPNCPCCKETHVFKYAGYTRHERNHDDSQEQSVSA